MWFFVALFIASFILTAFFSPKPKVENARAAQLSDFQFPRATEGDPVPRGYGTFRLKSPNTIWSGDFLAEPIKKSQKTGLFSSTEVITGYRYSVGLDMALILGPGVILKRIWLGKDVVYDGGLGGGSTTINLPKLYKGEEDGGNGGIAGTIEFYGGAFNQDQSPYMVAMVDDDYPASVGIAHIVWRGLAAPPAPLGGFFPKKKAASGFYFGNSANIQAPNFELQFFTNTLGLSEGRHIMPNGLDANPIAVLYDIYINDWGNLGADPALINLDVWRAAAYKVYTEGNGISLEIANANTGGDLSKEVLRQINAMIFQDPQTGLIEIKLIRQDYDIASLPVLTPTQVTKITSYTKKLWEETYNQVRVKYVNRENEYKDAATTQQDFANINFQKRLRSTDISMPGIYVGALASEVAARELANLNVPLFQCELEVNRTVSQLRPGDVFVLKWPEYEIEQMVVRIRKFGLGSFRDGSLTMMVAQDEFALDALVLGVPDNTLDVRPVHDAIDIGEAKFWELPYWLDKSLGTVAGRTRYAVFAVQPGQYSIGYDAYVVDDPEPVRTLKLGTYTSRGLLAGAVGRFDGWTTGKLATLTVDNLNDIDKFADFTIDDVRAGKTLFMIGDELFAYTTMTNLGGGSVRLEDVYRALIDTDWEAHADNSRVWFLTDTEGFFELDIAIEDASAFVLDVTDQERSDADDADIFDLAPVGRVTAPVPPDMVRMDGSRALGQDYDAGDVVAVDWRARDTDLAPIALETDAVADPASPVDYVIRGYVGTELRFEIEDIAASPYNLNVPPVAAGNAILRVYSRRAGQLSYTGAPFPVTFNADEDSLLVDGELVLFDGDTVEI